MADIRIYGRALLPSEISAIAFVDTTPPTLAPTVNPAILWPPNQKLVDVFVTAGAADDSGAVALSVAQISSTEPPQKDKKGQPLADWQVVSIDQETGVIHLQLRADRNGNGPGRTYTITIQATDPSANAATADVQVVVPRTIRAIRQRLPDGAHSVMTTSGAGGHRSFKRGALPGDAPRPSSSKFRPEQGGRWEKPQV